MQKKTNRFLSILLACLMILTTPMSVLAEESITVPIGETEETEQILEKETEAAGTADGNSKQTDTGSTGLEITGIETVEEASETLTITADLPEKEQKYQTGETAQELKVEATGEELTYQWMESTDGETFTVLERGGQTASFLPSTEEAGSTWYKVKVTGADGTSVESRAVLVTVEEPQTESEETAATEDETAGAEDETEPEEVLEESTESTTEALDEVALYASDESEQKAGKPVITSDAVGTTQESYTLPETKEIEFRASIDTNDENGNPVGTLTYQWYSNTEKSYEGATELADGKDGTVTVGEPIDYGTFKYGSHYSTWDIIPTTKTGTVYYFCKITNTLENGSSDSCYSGFGSVTVNVPEEAAFGIITGEDPVGKISVSVEDTVPERSDLKDGSGEPFLDPGPIGTLINATGRKAIYVYPSDTMTTVIARAGLLNSTPVYIRGSVGTGMGSYIYKIGDREEFDRGKDSGWMGSLNGWYTNTGFDNYKISDGTLQAGDVISLKYTTDLGQDIGASFTDQDEGTKLESMKIYPVTKSGKQSKPDFLAGEFDPDVHEYQVAYHPYDKTTAPWIGILIDAVPVNQQNRVRFFVGDKEYRGTNQIPLTEKETTITVKVENPSDDTVTPEIYTIVVCRDPELLKASSDITVIETARDGSTKKASMLYKEFVNTTSKTETLCNVFSGTLQADTADEDYRMRDLTVTLNTLPEGVSAELCYLGNSWKFDGKTLTVKDGALFTGKRTYTIRLTKEDGTREIYYLQLTKADMRLQSYSFIPMFGTSQASYTETLNGQQEGTWFQLDEQGSENGKVGFDPEVVDYNVYVGNFVDGLSFDASSLNMGTTTSAAMKLTVNGEEVYSWSKSNQSWSNHLKNLKDQLPIGLKEGTNKVTLEFFLYNNPKITRTYTLNIIKKVATAAELEEKILALPALEKLNYTNDRGTVESLKELYDKLSEEVKKEISEEAVEKLNAAVAQIEKLHQEGISQIETLKDLIDSYSGKVTDENYKDYEAAVTKSKKLFDAMSGWIYDQFMADYQIEYKAMNAALEIVQKASIAAGETNGKSTEYIDDFMVSANAFNLTLGAADDAYPVNFKDYIASAKRSGESCLPYNTPGRLKIEIADPTIFRIDSKLDTYKDGGLGGGGTYDNELYYMVPLKEGTTTFTVTLTDETGTYYGQTPKMVVHVNSAEEAAIESLPDKLTNINSLPYTTKYDTWYYWEGTEGAEFSFKVNGTDAKVSVLDYQGDGKTDYPVDADGNVTVLLKDGYNPIEVSAVYEGKRVTQVYGMRAKVISYTITNDSNPGQELKQGDTITLKITGLNTPVYKILRIYNPNTVRLWYDTDMPNQSQLVSGGTQYTIGTLSMTLTGSGTVTLSNGRIFESWWGSPLYSETAQGNTGGMAPQANGFFSHIADLSFDVKENPDYEADIKYTPIFTDGNVVKPGQTVTMQLDGFKVTDITSVYPVKTTNTSLQLQTAQTLFATNIPGLSQVTSEEYSSGADGIKGQLQTVKTVTFTVPEDTPDGVYDIRGGYISVLHGSSAYFPGAQLDQMFAKQIGDVKLIVEKDHTYGEWTVTKKATCTEDGERQASCTNCGSVKTEVIPATGHSFGAWTTTASATVFAPETQERTCGICGTKETRTSGNALTPTMKTNASKLTLQMKQKTTAFKVSGLAAGDSVASWKSSNTKIFTVSANGKLTAGKKTGKATLTVTLASGLQKKIPVTVQKKQVTTTKITGLKSKVTLEKGKKLTLKPALNPITSQQKFTYTSSNKKVATVSSRGVITAKKSGTAKITVKSGKKKFTVTVTVPKKKTTAITGVPETLSLKKGKSYTLKAKLAPKGSEEKLTYQTSNKKIVTVTKNGKLKAVKKGTATITVKSGSVTVKCKVTVK